MANIALLDRVIEHIEANPEKWTQAYYAWRTGECGTAHCVAGWAVHLQNPEARPAWVTGFDYTDTSRVIIDGTDRLYSDAGAEYLGLTSRQASLVFDEIRTLTDIREIRERLARDPDDTLDDLPYAADFDEYDWRDDEPRDEYDDED